MRKGGVTEAGARTKARAKAAMAIHLLKVLAFLDVFEQVGAQLLKQLPVVPADTFLQQVDLEVWYTRGWGRL